MKLVGKTNHEKTYASENSETPPSSSLILHLFLFAQVCEESCNQDLGSNSLNNTIKLKLPSRCYNISRYRKKKSLLEYVRCVVENVLPYRSRCSS